MKVGGGTGTINPSCSSANTKLYPSQIFSKKQANATAVNSGTGFVGGTQILSCSTLNSFRQDLVRVDHYVNDKLHFFARGIQDDAPSNRPTGLWGGNNYPGVVNVSINALGKNVVANLTWTISPKMVNEFEFAHSQGTIKGALRSGKFIFHSLVADQQPGQCGPLRPCLIRSLAPLRSQPTLQTLPILSAPLTVHPASIQGASASIVRTPTLWPVPIRSLQFTCPRLRRNDSAPVPSQLPKATLIVPRPQVF